MDDEERNRQAYICFSSAEYSKCIALLTELSDSQPAVEHNKALAAFYASGQTEGAKFKRSIEGIIDEVIITCLCPNGCFSLLHGGEH